MTKGIHTIRVQSTGGEFAAQAVTVARVGGPTAAPVPVSDPPAKPPAPGSKPTPQPTPQPATQSSALPGGWQSQDIGSPALRGSSRVDNGRWTVNGAGANIWGSEDEFQFAHRNLDGDGTLVARIDSMEDTHGWAKGGLMVRAGTGASAPFAAIYRTPDNGIMFEWRSRYRSTPRSVRVNVPDWPVWMKLVRRGNSFGAYYSTDGSRWTRLGAAQTVSMPSSVRAGLAVTSHDVGQVATATFSNVSIG
jgi:hypothetical protein